MDCLLGLLGLLLGLPALAPGAAAVLMKDEPDLEFSDNDIGFSNAFQTCLRAEAGADAGLLGCASRGAVAGLTHADAADALPLADDLQLVRGAGSEQAPRALLPIDRDPTDIRSVLDAAGAFLSRRALRWDLSRFYPGLVLKVGPSFTGVGVVEFVLERHRLFTDRQLGTGRLLLRRLLLPLLLGLKVKLVTLVPIFFLALVLIAKKALFFSKAALFISGFLGLNSLFLLQNQQSSHGSSGLGLGIFSDSPPRPGISILEDQSDLPVPPLGGGGGGSWADPLSIYKGHVFRGVNYPYQQEDPREGKGESRGGRNFSWESDKPK